LGSVADIHDPTVKEARHREANLVIDDKNGVAAFGVAEETPRIVVPRRRRNTRCEKRLARRRLTFGVRTE
jgi:hypothetical protein